MAAEAGGDIRAGIGSRLRAAREKKGLTLLQAAERMHVDARTLESLEAEDFAALGAPVYARGHLRHYAELVDESAPELQQLYADATRAAPAQPDLTRIARLDPVNDSSKLVGPVVIGLVAIALVGTVWWVLTLSVDKVQPTTLHSHVESNTAGSNNGPDAGASQTGPATAANTNTESDAPVALPAPTPEPSPQRGQKGGAGAKSGTPGPAATSPPAGAKAALPAATNTTPPPPPGATPVVAASNATAPPPSPRAKDGELTLKFSSDSWAEVYDASGQRLFYDVGAASSAHTVRGPAPLRVILGNASGVAVEYNGRPALIPAAVQPDGSARFVINARGRTVPASPASDGD
ncbi:MAG TPA: RodZ domain-containing protein [Steroidobacteraceae bacterium]